MLLLDNKTSVVSVLRHSYPKDNVIYPKVWSFLSFQKVKIRRSP